MEVMDMRTVAAVILFCSLVSVSVLHAQLAVRDYNFSTPGDLEGWTAIKYEPGTFSQAIASSGEGVLQIQMLSSGDAGTVDLQLFSNNSTATLPLGSTWDSIEFRARQLNDDSGAPGTPQTFNTTSTIMLIYNFDGATRNVGIFSAPYWSSTAPDADGWKVFSFDLAQYIADNGLNQGSIANIRLDPIGHTANYGKWLQIDYFRMLANVPRVTEPVYKEYSFETPSDTENWGANNVESNTFSQAFASGGEGVLQVRQSTNGFEDVQFYNNTDAQTIGSKRNWDTFEFRIRQLKDDGADAPGVPRSFVFTGTILYLPGYDGAARNLGQIGETEYWWRYPADTNGWTVFTFDFAQYIADNGISPNADITNIRLDPIGSLAKTAGDWAQVDYFKITATPQPPPAGTLFLLQ